MQLFDLHCDTLYKAVNDNISVESSDMQVSIPYGMTFKKWYQCMAIWIPDNISNQKGMQLFTKAHKMLTQISDHYGLNKPNKDNSHKSHNLIFTVENGKIIDNDLSVINYLAACKVKMLTLTWNAENCIGGGADAQNKGLSDFGKKCISKLESENIIVDISHASDKTFYDVFKCARKPVIASHSNSRSICNHKRNLTDEQFTSIVNCGGVVGLNFHKNFLSCNSMNASTTDLLKHTEHFLSLQGENTVCIGSDFDGSDIPDDLNNLQKISILYENFLKIGYNEQLVQKIMFYNAYNFFSRF